MLILMLLIFTLHRFTSFIPITFRLTLHRFTLLIFTLHRFTSFILITFRLTLHRLTLFILRCIA